MNVRRAYCSAVDRNVPVVLRSGAAPPGRVTLESPADLVCLDYRVRCTGWCCPLFSVDDEADPVSLARAANARSAGEPAPFTPEPKSRWGRRT